MQIAATAGHNLERPQPTESARSPSHTYETINHNHGQGNSSRQLQLTSDNSFTEPASNYVVPPPRYLNQPSDIMTYTPLVNINLYQMTGECNKAFDETPRTPPPPYSSVYLEILYSDRAHYFSFSPFMFVNSHTTTTVHSRVVGVLVTGEY
jgi:hypothetical protein